MVTLHTNTVGSVWSGTQSVDPANFYLISNLTAAYRPKQNVFIPVRINNDGVFDFGLVELRTTGDILIYRDNTTTTPWSLGVNTIYNFSVSYIT